MSIHYTCPCGAKLDANEEYIGERIRCPNCGTKLTIPEHDGMVARIVASPVPASVPETKEGPVRKWLRERSRRAVAAFVLGVLSPILLGVGGIVALVNGILALAEIRRSEKQMKGRRLAIAGIILGAIGIPVGCLGGLVALVWEANKITNEHARLRTQHNLTGIGLAFFNYHDHYGSFPPAALATRDGQPGLSWRVAILPFLEEEALFRQFKLDEPWDSPANRVLLERMPAIYTHPSRTADKTPGHTHFRVFTGPQTPFPDWQAHPSIEDFKDGLPKTLLVVEAADGVPWTKMDELPYSPDQPLPRLGGHCGKGFVGIMGDAGRCFIDDRTDENIIRALITINGGERILIEIPRD